MERLHELKAKQKRLADQARAILETAKASDRGLTDEEQREWDSAIAEAKKLGEKIETETELRKPVRAAPHLDIGDGRRAVRTREDLREGEVPILTRDQRVADFTRSQGRVGAGERSESLSLGLMLRGIATGNWHGADREYRVMSEGTPSAGGFLVPEPLAANLIDLARAKARTMQIGVRTVPMEAETLKMARVTGDFTAAWKAENAAGSFSNMSFDAVTFTARTLAAFGDMSVELVEDAQNLDQAVRNSLAQALALELDRVALRGNGVAPEPLGILGTIGVGAAELGTGNGESPTWPDLAVPIEEIRTANFEPNAALFTARTLRALEGLVDSTGQPLNPPTSVGELRKFSTQQIPENLTVGTSTDCSEIYVGQWDQCAVGMRTDNLRIEMSIEASDATSSAFKNLQVWVRAYLRADVQLLHPAAFHVTSGVRG